ncbi:MAG: glycosyltransferase [Candidatus Paceibacteria bacterium]
MTVKCTFVNTKDGRGGGGNATYRLHKGLRSIGVKSELLVRDKYTGDPTVTQISSEKMGKIRNTVDSIPLILYPKRKQEQFSVNWIPSNIAKKINKQSTDIAHLHWIGNGLMNIKEMSKIQKPIVWTIHDMWPLTGGCHYSFGCDKYQKNCGSCPNLNSNQNNDLSKLGHNKKVKYLQDIEFKIVSPSSWLAKKAIQSPFIKEENVRTIPNGIDISKYRPMNASNLHDLYDLPERDQVILTYAGDPDYDRLGIDLLREGFKELEDLVNIEDVLVVTFGTNDNILENSSFITKHVGYVSEQELIQLYSLADTTIVPSREDNLPNKVLEPMSCGTPCVAFNTGGIPDMVKHKENGYLATPFDPRDLAVGIKWLLNESNNNFASNKARQKVIEDFDIKKVAEEYKELYLSLID